MEKLLAENKFAEMQEENDDIIKKQPDLFTPGQIRLIIMNQTLKAKWNEEYNISNNCLILRKNQSTLNVGFLFSNFNYIFTWD